MYINTNTVLATAMLASVSSASVVPVDMAAATCNKADMATYQKVSARPIQFCKWWLLEQ